MLTFRNVTKYETYKNNKAHGNISFEFVPNTAAGYERTRCYIKSLGWKYFLAALNENEYFMSLCDDPYNVFTVNFRADGDQVTIQKASNKGRRESADKYLKKYANLVCMLHNCIKFDKVVEYIPYRA